MQQSQKVLYFDVETTGTNSSIHGIWQIAGLLEYGGEIVDEFNFKMCPKKGTHVDYQALKVGNLTVNQLKEFPPEAEVFEEFRAILDKWIDKLNTFDKFYPAGYNVQFDLDFLSKWFKEHDEYGLGSYCNWRQIDPLPVIRFASFCGENGLHNHKLETVCDYYGIDLKAHDAYSDIRATRDLIYKLKEEMFPLETIMQLPPVKRRVSYLINKAQKGVS